MAMDFFLQPISSLEIATPGSSEKQNPSGVPCQLTIEFEHRHE